MVYNNLRGGTKERRGRFAQRSDPKRLAKEFEVTEVPEVEARYNVSPTQEILAVRESADERGMAFFKRGLVPSRAKDSSTGARPIDARSETVGPLVNGARGRGRN